MTTQIQITKYMADHRQTAYVQYVAWVHVSVMYVDLVYNVHVCTTWYRQTNSVKKKTGMLHGECGQM